MTGLAHMQFGTLPRHFCSSGYAAVDPVSQAVVYKVDIITGDVRGAGTHVRPSAISLSRPRSRCFRIWKKTLSCVGSTVMDSCCAGACDCQVGRV